MIAIDFKKYQAVWTAYHGPFSAVRGSAIDWIHNNLAIIERAVSPFFKSSVQFSLCALNYDYDVVILGDVKFISLCAHRYDGGSKYKVSLFIPVSKVLPQQ